MTYFLLKDSSGDITATNLPKDFVDVGYSSKEFKLKDGGAIEFFTDDLILIKRSRIFRKVIEVSAPAISSIYASFAEQIREHSHTLKKIQGQLKQKIEGVIDTRSLRGMDYARQRKLVADEVRKDVESIADTLIYLQKRIFEIDAHISSFEIISMGDEIALERRPHNIRSLILNILHAFENESRETFIRPLFHFEDEFTETNKIELDYKTINTALYNFFDNVFKYAKPNSTLNFFLEVESDGSFKLKMSMISLRVEKDEVTKIFNFRYRGKNARARDGLGIGMYVVKKALELNGFQIRVLPVYSHMESYNSEQYILNEFVISGSSPIK